MSTSIQKNPVFELYNNNKHHIESSRTELFSKLGQIHPKIETQIQDLYKSHKKNHSLPYLGELYPWVISDLYSIENHKLVADISQSWMALYYYTIFVDKVIDSKDQSFEGDELISLTALMKEGLLKLYKSVIDTPYETLFETALNSVLNQSKREQLIHNRVESTEAKANYTKHKNDLLKMCAMAIISQSNIPNDKGMTILDFTDKLQLSFQYLDDITDLKEDFADNNYTVLLNTLLQEVNINYINQDNLLELLIEKQVLLKFSKSLVDLFDDVENGLKNLNNNASMRYIKSIVTYVKDLNRYLTHVSPNFPSLEGTQKQTVIQEVEKRIEILAITT